MTHAARPPDRRRLARLRLHPGAEPIAVQVERHRRTTVALTLIPAGIAAIFVLIFAGFGRPDVGAAVAGVVVGPVVLVAWWDYLRIRAAAAALMRDRSPEADAAATAPGRPTF